MVKCQDCGFLAVRDHYSDAVCEASEFTRSTGRHKSSNGSTTVANIFCFVGAKQFTEDQTGSAHSSLTTMQCEFECHQFKQYIQGRNAREHVEMTLIEKVQSENRIAQEHIRREQDEAKRLSDERYAKEELERAADRARADRAEARADKAEARAEKAESRARIHFWGIIVSLLLSSGTAVKALSDWINPPAPPAASQPAK